MRKIMLFLLGIVVLTTVGAVGAMMLMGASERRITEVVLLAAALSAALVMAGGRRKRSYATLSRPIPSEVPSMQYFGTGPNNQPVMMYKGEPFDFVHNDPTAPDPR